ncbi:MAG: hypothetical protein LBF26_01225 [Puniceicoccales bacterium]|jgi:hypothetical protein|nr:hypothetical protein [Puniceicoccales bacterium]
MNGVGVGDFASVKFGTLTAVESATAGSNIEKSTMPTVQDTMRETATSNPYEPNNDATEILKSVTTNSAYVPVFPPIDMVTFDDTDNETVAATRSHASTATVEGNFGESAAVAPQDASAGAEVRPNSEGGEGGLSIDVETFVESPPEGLQLTSGEVIDTIERHLAQEDITSDMRLALELTRDGFERAMEALQGNDFGANERAIDAMEKAFDASTAAREVAIDAYELDFASEIREMAGNLRNYAPKESSKAILGVMMSIFALLNLRDGPELRGPTWQGGLAHAVLDPATPAYAKKKATRILNMAQRYKEIMKQQQARTENHGTKADQPKQGRPPQAPKQKEKSARGDAKTSLTSEKDEGSTVDAHNRAREAKHSSDSNEDSGTA